MAVIEGWWASLVDSMAALDWFYIAVSDVSSSPVEVPFNCILFEELLHKGTFKVVHHGIVNHPTQGVLGAEVAVKRLKGETGIVLTFVG